MYKIGTSIILPQWFAGLGVTLMLLQSGVVGGMVSPMLAKLMAPNSVIPLSPEEASWLASLSNIGRLFGAFIGSIATVYVGTKRTVFITLIPFALGWLGFGLANTVPILYAARMSSGVAVGMVNSAFPLYVGEVAMTEIRGALVSFASFGVPIGQLLGSIANNYLELMESSSIYLAICVLLMVIFIILPESPHHLTKIGNLEAAKKSISWYRSGRGVDEEVEDVKKFVGAEIGITFTKRLQEFQKPGVRRATYHVMILFMFMQICGLNSIIYYMEIILRQSKCTLISPAEIVVYINVCGAVSTAISIFLIDRCGRRFLLLLSGAGVAVSMIMMSSHFFVIHWNFDTLVLEWLPILSLLLFMLFFFIGLMPVPSAMMSEIIPSNVKCIVTCIGSFVAGIIAFLSTKTYQPMVDLMGEAYVFLIYAIFALLVIPYALFVMPETKGKSLQQIEDELMKE